MQSNRIDNVKSVEVTLRIPGTWSGPEEFVPKLPRGCRCTPDALILADGSQFELNVLPADEDFPRVFAGGCPKLPTEAERIQIEDFTVNICLTGPGGSIAAAKRLMAAAAAVIVAGGAGVFVDNSGISHGATDWLALHNSADDGGVFWAFVSAVRNKKEIFSVGMHVLGFRDAIIPATGNKEYDHRTLHSFLGFTAFSGKKLQDGEIVGDTVLPTFCVHSEPHDRVPDTAPMFNPFGQWRLVPYNRELN